MQNKLRTNTTTIETMLNDIIPNLRQYLDKDILILDILPYMLEILQPRLRQVKISFDFLFFVFIFEIFRQILHFLLIKKCEILKH
jgi:hypothetical protein